jgi:hypothetical protein
LRGSTLPSSYGRPDTNLKPKEKTGLVIGVVVWVIAASIAYGNGTNGLGIGGAFLIGFSPALLTFARVANKRRNAGIKILANRLWPKDRVDGRILPSL